MDNVFWGNKVDVKHLNAHLGLGFVMKTILTCNNELFMQIILIKNYDN